MAKLPPGRALWEPSSAIDHYGTTLALELLPHFTHGRIAPLQGLSHKQWLDPSAAWFDDASALDRPLVDSGPAAWVRAGAASARFTPKTPLPPVTVSDVKTTDDTVSFDVSQPGVPVMVKTSYFPNWRATGANGPWRATPNLMVVIPTRTHVSLHYGRTPVDWAGTILTIFGLLGLAGLANWKLVPLAPRPPRRRRTETAGAPPSGPSGPPGPDPAGPSAAEPAPLLA